MDELTDIIYSLRPLVVCLSETWLDDSHTKGFLNIKGYKFVRKDRSNNIKLKYGKNRGGGVAIIYRDDLHFEECKQLNTPDNEMLWVKGKLNGRNHLIGAAYRPQFLDMIGAESEAFENLLESANSISRNIIIMGDLNIDLLRKNKEKDRLDEMMKIHGYKQLVDTPTRSSEKSESLIDHVWVSKECCYSDSGTIEGISDHAGTYLSLQKEVEELAPKPKYGRSYKHYSPAKTGEDFLSNLTNSTFYEDIEKKDVDKATAAWVDSLRDACDTNAPILAIKPRREAQVIPWGNQELEDLKRERFELVCKNRDFFTSYRKKLLAH